MDSVVILGGTGFIGTHLAQHLLLEDPQQRIVLVDIQEPRKANYCKLLQQGIQSGRVQFILHDVRMPIPDNVCEGNISAIYNLAAVHREPGHKAEEYFGTNLPAADMACRWAEKKGCKRVVFMSSISPYGPAETIKNELSNPQPETPYGTSKLAAEEIHQSWQAAGPERQLLIIRPGVVFGPGENGNVTRLVHSVVKGYFVYMGNRHTCKAAGYVKELCRVAQFAVRKMEEGEASATTVLNFTIDPPPTIEEFVRVIQRVTHLRRPILSVPRRLLVGIAYVIAFLANLFAIKQPISPVRVRKLFRSTNVEALMLRRLRYKYCYTLESAFADWKREAPEDFA